MDEYKGVHRQILFGEDHFTSTSIIGIHKPPTGQDFFSPRFEQEVFPVQTRFEQEVFPVQIGDWKSPGINLVEKKQLNEN